MSPPSLETPKIPRQTFTPAQVNQTSTLPIEQNLDTLSREQNFDALTNQQRNELGLAFFKEFLKPGSGQYTMDFCTLGMFIIGSDFTSDSTILINDYLDEIHFPPPKPPVHNVIGGAGAYAAIGARITEKPALKHLVSWTIHVGNDFPVELKKQITDWGTEVNWIDTKDRLTTRGWNKYGPDDCREFKYLTPKIRVDHTQLTEKQLLAKCFHFICSPARCIDLVNGILEARQKIKASGRLVQDSMTKTALKPMDPPLFVWEPVPDCCTPDELPNVLEALRYVDVISPNHHELAMLFGETDKDPFMACELSRMERQCNELLTYGFGKKPSAVVVRRGERGCYIASDTRHSWYPAYHRPKHELASKKQEKWTQKVVDPTGGGNTFLGGFCIGLLNVMPEGKTNFEEAAIFGSVAASFAIEQVGMPSLSSVDGVEMWNGDAVTKRLEKFVKRLSKLERLNDNERFKSSLYGPIPTVIFGREVIRTDRIPADFEGVRTVPTEVAPKC